MKSSNVLLVDLVSSRLISTQALLEATGYSVHATDTFSDAKRRLYGSPPDLLVTQLRLGPNNGLHLVLLGRHRHPEMGAIVTCSNSDAFLEAETTRMGAVFMRSPVADSDLLASVRSIIRARLVDTTAPTRDRTASHSRQPLHIAGSGRTH